MNNFLAAPEPSSTIDSNYDHLTSSLQELPTLDGINLLKQFLQTYPSYAHAHNDLGVLFLQAGNPTLALAHHEKACRLQPDNITFRKNLADFYAVELGWLDDAVDIYLEILKRNPRDTEALIAVGKLGSAMEGELQLVHPHGRLEAPTTQPASVIPQAVPQSLVSPASPVSQRSFDELYGEALGLAEQGCFVEARKKLENLLDSHPGIALLYNDLGVVCYSLGDAAASQGNYEKAVSLAPGNAVFMRNLADFYFTVLNRQDDAINIYLDLHRQNPRDIETLISLGHISTAVGRPVEAESFYQRVLDIEPLNEDARQAFTALTETSRKRAAQAACRSAEDLLAESSQYAADNRLHEAHSLLEELVHQYPENALAFNNLGVLRYQLADTQGAAKAYEKAVALQPHNTTFRKNLADLYFVELGRTDDAISMYLGLLKEHPQDVDTLTSLGQICDAIGRPEEAKSFYRRGLEIDPWNTDIRGAAFKD